MPILKSDVRQYTKCTTTSIVEIRKQLQETRERGFSVSEQEFEEGINAVAAPILDAHQDPIAAMAIVGPAFRLDSKKLLELGRVLCDTTESLARDMGFRLK